MVTFSYDEHSFESRGFFALTQEAGARSCPNVTDHVEKVWILPVAFCREIESNNDEGDEDAARKQCRAQHANNDPKAWC